MSDLRLLGTHRTWQDWCGMLLGALRLWQDWELSDNDLLKHGQ